MTRLEQLRMLAAAEPKDPMAHLGVGLECVELERWDEAVTAFDRALAIDAAYLAGYHQKARAQISAGRHDEARATLEKGMGAARTAGDVHAEDTMRELLEMLP